MSILWNIKAILGCQFYAPWLMLDPPCIRRIKVMSVEHRPREMTDLLMGWGHLDPPQEQPERLLIECYMPTAHGAGRSMLEIDLEQEVIQCVDWGNLTGYEYLGSAVIGVMLLGAPGLILTLPIWFPIGMLRNLFERWIGMSLDTWSVWLRIRKQVPEEFRQRVRRAFLNRHNGTEDAWLDHQRAAYEAELDIESDQIDPARAKVIDDDVRKRRSLDLNGECF